MLPLIAGISVVGAQKEQKLLSKTKQIFKLQHEFNIKFIIKGKNADNTNTRESVAPIQS